MGRGGRIGVGATDGAGGSEGTGGGGGALGGQKGAAPLPPFVARRPGGSRSAANGAQRGPALPSVAPFIRFARSSVPSPVHRSVHSLSSPFGDAAAVAAAPPPNGRAGRRGGTGHCGAKSRGWGGGVKCGADLGWVWGGVEASLQELSAAGAAAVRTGGDGEERGEAGGNREPRAARSGENREHREFYWEEKERSGGGGRGAAGAPGGERGAEAGGKWESGTGGAGSGRALSPGGAAMDGSTEEPTRGPGGRVPPLSPLSPLCPHRLPLVPTVRELRARGGGAAGR